MLKLMQNRQMLIINLLAIIFTTKMLRHSIKESCFRTFLQDPDAPSRMSKLLDELDREDEARFLKCIFSCIRAGRINEVSKYGVLILLKNTVPTLLGLIRKYSP